MAIASSIIAAGVGAAIGAGGSIIAANKAKKAANNATAAQLQMYNQTRADLAPYMATGSSALSQLASLWGLGGANGGLPNGPAMMSALESFPGYQFGREQGIKALDSSGAARGLLLSGAQLEDTQKFGTNYAIQQGWLPYVSMLSDLTRVGQSSAAGVGSAGTQTGAGMAQSMLAAGSAAGNGIAGAANSLGNFVQSAYGAFGQGGGMQPIVSPASPLQTIYSPQAQVPFNPGPLTTLNPNFG